MAGKLPEGTTLARGLPPLDQIRWPVIASRELFELRYGKALTESSRRPGEVLVYGTNGPCGTHETALFRGPGVILGRKGQGPLGVEWSESDYWVIDTAYSLKPLRSDINLRFAYYLIKFVGLNHLKDGTSNPTLSRDSFGAQAFPLPPTSSQLAIAHILGTLDDKIELNRRMNETLEAMARALFKSWFVDFEPVRAKAEGRWRKGESLPGLPAHLFDLFPDSFEDSELGEIPKGWSSLAIYDLATYVNGAAYTAFQPNSDRCGLPIIKIAELKAGITSQTKFSDVQMPEKYRLQTGDILFSWSGNPDTSIDTFVWAHGPAWLNQHIFRVEPRSADERSFVLATLKYLRPVFAEIARNKQTTGLGHVTAGDMQRLLFVKPEARVLAAWNRQAAPFFDAVFLNEQEALNLSCIRDTLLPALLSGELPVGDSARVLEVQA